MFRSLLILILGGLLAWLVLKLVQTIQIMMPRDENVRKKSSSPLGGKKIIDAEFEDLISKENKEDKAEKEKN